MNRVGWNCRELFFPPAPYRHQKLEEVLWGHGAVKLCYQLRPSQADADYTKFGAISTVRKSERRYLK
jgi:hypothetical protein